MNTRLVLERFFEKIRVRENGCWEWQAGLWGKGYGQFRESTQRRVMAHRFSYELAKGVIPKGKTLDHLCRNRKCVNPEHLEAVPLRENILRGNGAPAQNNRKTHCLRGHLFDEQNTYLIIGGGRECRTCRRIKDNKRNNLIRLFKLSIR